MRFLTKTAAISLKNIFFKYIRHGMSQLGFFSPIISRLQAPLSSLSSHPQPSDNILSCSSLSLILSRSSSRISSTTVVDLSYSTTAGDRPSSTKHQSTICLQPRTTVDRSSSTTHLFVRQTCRPFAPTTCRSFAPDIFCKFSLFL